MMQNQYSNINGVESLWDSHTVQGSSASQSAVRWYQVPVSGGNIGSATQAATWNPDTANRFMPSVDVDHQGDMAIGYSVSSSTLFPAIRYAGRLASDPLNTFSQTETSLIEGTGSQNGMCGGSACDRWGDYSAMTLDPDGCTFWYANEYYVTSGLNDHTRIGAFSFPGCTPITDSTPPTVSSISRSDANPTSSSTVHWAVTFSESVTGVNASDFSLANTGLTSPSITGVSGSGASYSVTASTGTGDGSLGLNLNDNDSITDAAGNKLGGTGIGNGNFTGQVYMVDKAAPAVSSVDRADANPTNASTVHWNVTFSESVTGVNSSDFALVNAGLISPSISGVSGSGASYSVTASTGTGDGSLGLNLNDNDSITDAAGNKLGGTGIGNGNFTGQVYTVQKSAPTVSSINRSDANPSNAPSVHWTVTFSESVTGVDSSDFALANTGLTSPSIGLVTGSGSSYSVTVSTGTGDGSLGLNLVDDDSITDSSANKLGGTGTGNGNFTGQVYTVDKTAPTVSSINRTDPNPTNGSTLHWTVTFSESVTGVDAGDFALANTGLSGPAISGLTGSGSTYTVTASTGSGDGSLGLNLVDDDSITDAAINALGGTGTGNGNLTGQVYTVSTTTTIFRWRTVRSSHAYGGSYTTDHLAGGRATIKLSGTSITWFTMTGPNQGLARVSIDGAGKGTFNQYAPATHFKVARRFSGLSAGPHTVSIIVKGRRGSPHATGTFVSIDAFKAGGNLISKPIPIYTWRKVVNKGAIGGSYTTSDTRGSSVTFRFHGTGVEWYTILGPNQGKAKVSLDGGVVATVDDYATKAHFGIGWSATGLTDDVHTVKITVLGKKRRASSGRLVGVDDFRAI
jgi:hypothetical protein